MIRSIQRKQSTFIYRTFSAFIAVAFIFSSIVPPQRVYAQTPFLNLPVPGVMVPMSPGYTPALIKGITIHPENPLEFDFIVDRGDDNIMGQQLEEETKRMVKYFLATLTIPENDLWVNLSPYEKDKIIPEKFGLTEMGRDLLAQDYILKQLSSSMIYPEQEIGSKFWERVYNKAQAQYGTTEIPMNTFNKIWIVPESAFVYEHGNSAFVVESKLKVMLEEDYLALEKNRETSKYGLDQLDVAQEDVISGVISEVVRDVLIPEIEKEVNEGKNFAALRQIYHSMILAAWYKKNLKQGLLGQVYVDKGKIKGIDVDDPKVKQKIYEQYLKAFEKGVFDYIKEDVNPATQEVIPRKYFSGGKNFGNIMRKLESSSSPASLTPERINALPGKNAVSINLLLAETSEEATVIGGGAEGKGLASSPLDQDDQSPGAGDRWVDLDISDSGIAKIQIKAKNELNALTDEHIDQLIDLVQQVSKSQSAKILIFDGGKNFSVGADVFQILQNRVADPQKAIKFYEKEKELHSSISALDIPTITRARGFTIGGGLGIAVATDFIIIDGTTRISMPEVKISFITDVGGIWFLPNKMGKAVGKYYGLTGLSITPNEAYGFGLVEGFVLQEDENMLIEHIKKLAETEDQISHAQVKAVIDQYSPEIGGFDNRLKIRRENIERHFGYETVEEIVQSLTAEAGIEAQMPLNLKPTNTFALEALAAMKSASATAVYLENKLINTLGSLPREEAREAELLFAQDLTLSEWYVDGVEGLKRKDDFGKKFVSGEHDSHLDRIIVSDGEGFDQEINAKPTKYGSNILDEVELTIGNYKYALPAGTYFVSVQAVFPIPKEDGAPSIALGIDFRNSQWSNRDEIGRKGVLKVIEEDEIGARILKRLNSLNQQRKPTQGASESGQGPYLLQQKEVDWEAMQRDYEADPSAFWLQRAHEELEWFKKPTIGFRESVDGEGHYRFSYFEDGELNASYEILDRQVKRGLGDHVAYTWISDPADDQGNADEVKTITYSELLALVNKFANALTEMGVGKGDGVTLYTASNTIEAKVMRFAAMRIGAIFTPVFPGLSAQEISDRAHQINTKVVLTVDGGYRKGEILKFKEGYVDRAFEEYIPKDQAREFVNQALTDAGVENLTGQVFADEDVDSMFDNDITIHFHTLMKLVGKALNKLDVSRKQRDVVSNSILKSTNTMPSRINNMVVIERIGRGKSKVSMKEGRDVFFDDVIERMEAEGKTEFEPVSLPAEHPLFVIFTSGSEGKPKGVYHTTGGYLTNISYSFKFAWDVKPGMRIWVSADDGWITGNSAMSDAPLLNGMHSFLYEGLPNWPTPDRLWKMLAENKIEIYKTGVTAVRNFSKDDSTLITKHDLSNLKYCASCAEPLYAYVQAFWINVIMGGNAELLLENRRRDVR